MIYRVLEQSIVVDVVFGLAQNLRAYPRTRQIPDGNTPSPLGSPTRSTARKCHRGRSDRHRIESVFRAIRLIDTSRMALKQQRAWHGEPEVATFANAMALAVGPLLQLALLPFFRTRLGAAGLGLYGLLVVSWGLLSAFEAVVGPGLQRRIARSGRSDAARSIAASIERAAWAVVALTIIGSAALTWYAPQLTFGSNAVSVPLLVLAGAIVARLPTLLYGILLTALRAPLQLAVWRVGGEVLRIAGAALALHVTSGSVTGFIAWQGIAVGVQAAAGAILLRRLCPPSTRTSLSTSVPVATMPILIRTEIIVALPLLLGLLLAQLDRLALALAGAWIPLGQYTLAFMLAGAQLFLSTAAVAVVAPH